MHPKPAMIGIGTGHYSSVYRKYTTLLTLVPGIMLAKLLLWVCLFYLNPDTHIKQARC